MLLDCPGGQASQRVFEGSGCVPEGQAWHDILSAPISLLAQASQNVEKPLNVHLLPNSHGFSMQVSMSTPTVWTAERPSTCESMLVLLIRTLSAPLNISDVARGASLRRKTLSRMKTGIPPDVSIAPALAALMSKS